MAIRDYNVNFSIRVPTSDRHGWVDVNATCRNYKATYGRASNVRMGNRASAIRVLADAVQRALGRMPRVTFNQSQPLTGSNTSWSETQGSAPLYGYRFYDGVVNARSWMVSLAAGNPNFESNTLNCYFGHEGGAANTPPHNLYQSNGAVNYAHDCFYPDMTLYRGNSANAETNVSFSTYGGFMAFDVCVQDKELVSLTTDPDEYDSVLSGEARPGGDITNGPIDRIRSTFHRVRERNLPHHGQYTAYGVANAYQKYANSGPQGIYVNSTGYVNLFDQDCTDRAWNTPGFLCYVRHGGIGVENTALGSRVRSDCGVFAACDSNGTGYGTIAFVGPGGNVEINIPSNATANWFGWEGNCVFLNAAINSRWTNSERNKIDAMGKVSAAGTNVWFYHVGCHERFNVNV